MTFDGRLARSRFSQRRRIIGGWPRADGKKQGSSNLAGWIGLIISFFALILSVLTAYFTWISTASKFEAVSFNTDFSRECAQAKFYQLDKGAEDDDTYMGACWIVTVSNKSENRISFIGVDTIDDFLEGDDYFIYTMSPAKERRDESGFPFSIDGGETKQIIVAGMFSGHFTGIQTERIMSYYEVHDNKYARKNVLIKNGVEYKIGGYKFGEENLRGVTPMPLKVYTEQVESSSNDSKKEVDRDIGEAKFDKDLNYNLNFITGRGNKFELSLSFVHASKTNQSRE